MEHEEALLKQTLLMVPSFPHSFIHRMPPLFLSGTPDVGKAYSMPSRNARRLKEKPHMTGQLQRRVFRHSVFHSSTRQVRAKHPRSDPLQLPVLLSVAERCKEQ